MEDLALSNWHRPMIKGATQTANKVGSRLEPTTETVYRRLLRVGRFQQEVLTNEGCLRTTSLVASG